MKAHFLILLLIPAFASSAPLVTTVDWRPACEGATIEVVSDSASHAIQSIRATAFHSEVIVEWNVHYVDGTPVSAEYRESERKRILEGDDAGGYSGDTPLVKLRSFQWNGTEFLVIDRELKKELTEILALASAKPDKSK